MIADVKLSEFPEIMDLLKILEENGLFKQRIVDGEQVELADNWLPSGGVWLVPHPEKSVSVKFGGKIEEKWENGSPKFMNYDYEEVKECFVGCDVVLDGAYKQEQKE